MAAGWGELPFLVQKITPPRLASLADPPPPGEGEDVRVTPACYGYWAGALPHHRHRRCDLDAVTRVDAPPRHRLDTPPLRAVERRAVFRIDVARERKAPR